MHMNKQSLIHYNALKLSVPNMCLKAKKVFDSIIFIYVKINNVTYPSNPWSSHSSSRDRACPSYSVTIKEKQKNEYFK